MGNVIDMELSETIEEWRVAGVAQENETYYKYRVLNIYILMSEDITSAGKYWWTKGPLVSCFRWK